MLKPRIDIPEPPPFENGCAHEEDRLTKVSEDLCKVRSGDHRRRAVCESCKSPYKARAIRRTKNEDPPEFIPMDRSEQELRDLWHNQVRESKEEQHFAHNDNDDDMDELVGWGSGSFGQSIPQVCTAEVARSSPAVTSPPTTKAVSRERPKLDGSAYLALTDSYAKYAKDVIPKDDTTIQRLSVLMGVDVPSLRTAMRLSQLAPAVWPFVVGNTISVTFATWVALYPTDLQPIVVNWFVEGKISASYVQGYFLRGGPKTFEARARELGLDWPDELDEYGVKRS